MILSDSKNRFYNFFYFGLFALAIIIFANSSALAQRGVKKKAAAHGEPQKPVILIEANTTPSNVEKKAPAVKEANIYIESLRELLIVREREVEVAKEKLNKIKELFAEGIVSKRAVEEAEVSLADAQTKADDVKIKMTLYESPTLETKKLTEETTEKNAEKVSLEESFETDTKTPSAKKIVQTRSKAKKKIAKVKSN